MLTGILHVTESAENASARQDADFETILEHLNAVYCGKIAHEFMHLPVSTASWENKCEIRLIIDNNSLQASDAGGITLWNLGTSLSSLLKRKRGSMSSWPNQR